MRSHEYRTLEVHMADEATDAVIVHTPGPVATVTVDPWGVVTVQFQGRTLKVCTVDPGPGGPLIYVEGPHTDGAP